MEKLNYPVTRREPTSESLGGVTFPDPYRWLEDDGATRAWDREQNALTTEYLRGWAHDGKLRERLPVPPVWFPGGQPAPSGLGPFRAGERWLQFELRVGDFPRLQRSETPLGAGSTVFDPGELPDGHPRWMKWVVGSPDGRLAAICFMRSVGGREPEALRVLDLETGQLRPDRIEGAFYPYLGGVKLAWLADSSGFYYLGQEPASGPPRWRPGFVAFHRLGESEDRPGFALGDCILELQASPDGRYVAVIEGFAAPRASWIREADPEGEWRPFLPEAAERAHGVFHGDHYVAVVTAGAPKGRLVSIPLKSAGDQGTWTEIVPEGERVAWSVEAAGDALVLALGDDSGRELHLVDADGSARGRVELPAGLVESAESVGMRGITPDAGGFVFWHNTFTTLPAAYRYDLSERTLRTLVPAPVEPDLALTILEGRAADGTALRVRIMHRRGLDVSAPRPLLLSGYGNLNQAFVGPGEGYGAFLDAGGVYAWATIPGGGEFGETWWHQGYREHMGRRGHDLAAVAELLIARGWTTSDQLAIIGGSGGGVLTSMAITERPGLYRAAAILFPQTDFARYLQEPYGRSWVVGEWGNPEDPEMAAAIRQWSPYHNVRPGERYPATFFFVGTEDGICPPWHSRKLVASLQEVAEPERPILLRVVGGFGHAVGEPDAVAALVQEPMAFLMRELGMQPGSGHLEGAQP